MNMLAGIINIWDPSGIWCFASLIWLIIIGSAYKAHWLVASITCSTIFLLAVLTIGTGDYVCNENHTKWMKKNNCLTDTERYDCVFEQMNTHTDDRSDDYWVFIPEEELYRITGPYNSQPMKMKINDEKPSDNPDEHYYNYSKDVTLSSIPQWLYHPASALWLFGIAGLPALVLMGFVLSELK